MPPGTWKMPVPWFLLSLALGPSPMVLSLERLMGPQDAARCSPVSLGPWEGWGRFRVQTEAHQGPRLAPVTADATTRTALAGLSGTDGVRGEWGRGQSWVCLLLGEAWNREPQKGVGGDLRQEKRIRFKIINPDAPLPPSQGLSCHLWGE